MTRASRRTPDPAHPQHRPAPATAAHPTQPTDPARPTGAARRTVAATARVLSAAAGGLAVAGSFAPSTRWWLAIVGIALLTAAVNGRRLRSALGLGLIFGLALYLPLLSWVTVYVGGIALALPVVEAALTAPAVAMMAAATRRLPAWPVFAAAAWVAGEALRARFPFGGFPWGNLAFTQVDGPLLPAAGLVGSAGLSFLTALSGAGLTAALYLAVEPARRRPAPLTTAVLALATPLIAAQIGTMTAPGTTGVRTLQVAVIQGNVPQPGLDFNAERRAVTDLHARQTAELAQAVRDGRQPAPDLVIWPENSSDLDPFDNPDAYTVIDTAVKDIGVPVLIGAVIQDADPTSPGTYNQGILWDPVTGPGTSYTKRHPVPFAEYMPYRSFFRIFSPWVDSAGYFIPGTTPGAFTVAGTTIGDVICFEIVNDTLVRDVIDQGASVLVVQTNNATFGYTNETYQQQAMSRVRAVEHGRPVLIAATSGVSAVIRPDGTVADSISLFTPGHLNTALTITMDTTPGTHLGAPIEWTLTAAAVLALTAATAAHRRRHPHPTSRATRPSGRPRVQNPHDLAR